MWSDSPADRKGLAFIYGQYKVSRHAESITPSEQCPSLLFVEYIHAKMQLAVSFVLASVLAATAFADPCADISSSKWVTPKQVRACFTSFKVDQTLKANVSFLYYSFPKRIEY